MGTNGTEISWEKFPENPEIVKFPKSEPFNRNFRKFRDESQMERKYSLFRNLCKFPIFYSALASSFGQDHSELDISRRDDGDAHSIKETLQNLSTYMSINTSYS